MQDESTEPAETPVEEAGDEESEELIASPLKRVAMVIFSPRLVFESLVVKSTRWDWILPLCLSLLVSLCVVNVGYDYIRNDQIEAATNRIENNTKLTDEQKSAQMEQITKYMEKMSGFTHIMANVSIVVGTFFALAVIALVMRAVAAFMLHGRLTFRDAFVICTLGSMISLVGTVIRIPLMFSLESFAQAKLSIGFLLPENMQESFLVKLIDFDLFTLWYLIIISIGMCVFAKTSLKKTLIPMAMLWFVYHVATQLISSGMSGMGS